MSIATCPKFQIHLSTVVMLVLSGSSFASDQRKWALWDGAESVEAYAKRADLPAKLDIEFRENKLELVLIPGARFVMGVAPPRAPENSVVSADVVIAFGAAVIFALVTTWFKFRAPRSRLNFSLRGLLLFCVSCGVIMWGVMLREKLIARDAARYATELERYYKVRPSEMVHPMVTGVHPFYLGKYPVTQKQFESVLGRNPSLHKGPTLPVHSISLFEANLFCEALTVRLNYP